MVREGGEAIEVLECFGECSEKFDNSSRRKGIEMILVQDEPVCNCHETVNQKKRLTARVETKICLIL